MFQLGARYRFVFGNQENFDEFTGIIADFMMPVVKVVHGEGRERLINTASPAFWMAELVSPPPQKDDAEDNDPF